MGECLLERYAKDNPATEQSVTAAKEKLEDAERHLKVVLKENGTVSVKSAFFTD